MFSHFPGLQSFVLKVLSLTCSIFYGKYEWIFIREYRFFFLTATAEKMVHKSSQCRIFWKSNYLLRSDRKYSNRNEVSDVEEWKEMQAVNLEPFTVYKVKTHSHSCPAEVRKVRVIVTC